MINYSNEELLNGILRNDNVILQHIYKNYYYKVNLYINKNSGNDDDANDIFQEAIIVVYRKLLETQSALLHLLTDSNFTKSIFNCLEATARNYSSFSSTRFP